MGPEGKGERLLMGGLWAPHVEWQGPEHEAHCVPVDTEIHMPLTCTPAQGVFCECRMGRTEEEGWRKCRMTGGLGMDGQREATEEDVYCG